MAKGGKRAADTENEGMAANDFTSGFFAADGPFATLLKSVDPKLMFAQGVDLTKTMFAIAAGKSDIAPDGRDPRFKHDAWNTNPAYKRLAQTYLATAQAVEKMIPDDLSLENKQRAELAASIVTTAMAPTNTLMGNPAAMEKTFETGSVNLIKGLGAFLDDIKNNGGLPKQVDKTKFEVGGNLAMTPGKVVLRHEMFELIHYVPSTAKVHEIPVLLIPPQINRYYFTDLAPGRSFAEYVVGQGLQYFAVSWRNPGPDQRDWDLDKYADAALAAIAAVAEITGEDRFNLVGFCAGGVTSAMVLSYLAAKGKSKVNSLALCVTMLDFKVDASLGAFRLPAMLDVVKGQAAKKGILPGSELGKVFTWLRPNDLVWNYWVNNYLMGEPPAAFDILAWNNNSTNLPAGLLRGLPRPVREQHAGRAGQDQGAGSAGGSRLDHLRHIRCRRGDRSSDAVEGLLQGQHPSWRQGRDIRAQQRRACRRAGQSARKSKGLAQHRPAQRARCRQLAGELRTADGQLVGKLGQMVSSRAAARKSPRPRPSVPRPIR